MVHEQRQRQDEPHRVVFAVFEGMQLLDLAGPADVFRAATLLLGGTGYEVVTASVDGEPVRADDGIVIAPDTSLADLRRSRRPLGTLAVLLGQPLAETEQILRGLEDKRVVRIEMAARPAGVSPDPSPGSGSSSASA